MKPRHYRIVATICAGVLLLAVAFTVGMAMFAVWHESHAAAIFVGITFLAVIGLITGILKG